jgi:hypothetical protein
MRGGEVEFKPIDGPAPASGPSSAANQTTQDQQNQNNLNHQRGGKKRRSATRRSTKRRRGRRGTKQRRGIRQRGGMSPVSVCGSGSFLNSPDGFGYIPPPGCIQVPVIPYGQELATASVHISATGQANAEFDNRIK